MQLFFNISSDFIIPLSAFFGGLLGVIINSIIGIVKTPQPKRIIWLRNKEVLFDLKDWKVFYKKVSIFSLGISLVMLTIFLSLLFTIKGKNLIIAMAVLFFIFAIYAITIDIVIVKQFKKLNKKAKDKISNVEKEYNVFGEM